VATIFKDYDIIEDMQDLLEYMSTEKFLDICERGTKQEFIDAFGNKIDPISQKLMNAYGPDFVSVMPAQMIWWIKDGTLLWLKNKGAGNPTTEEEVMSEQKKLERRGQLNTLKELFEDRIENQSEEIKSLKAINEEQQTEID
jgi:hypothetical protein